MLDVQRVEKKYPINVIDMEILKERLGAALEPDRHNGENGYIVRSLYFDSYQNMDYYAKADGLCERKKIRMRIYDPEDTTVKLEVKEKVDGRQRKRSLSITRREAMQMLRGEYAFLLSKEDALSKTLYFYLKKEGYRPRCIVEYDRYAFIHQSNDTRVTFDQNLRCSCDFESFLSDSIVWIPAEDRSRITMEVKYNRFLLSAVKNAVSNRITLEVSSSKYCKAREKLGI